MSECERCTIRKEPECASTTKVDKITVLDRQVGGSHYKDLVFQPGGFVTKNRFTYFPSSVIKRMCRYDKPTGKGLQDLQKAKHEIDLIIELEGWGGGVKCPTK